MPPEPSSSSGELPFEVLAYFHKVSVLIYISHCKKSDSWGGMRQATDGHAVPDPKTLHLHFWRPPDTTQEIFQDIMPEIALLEALYHCDFECQSVVLFDTYSAVSLLLLLYCPLFFTPLEFYIEKHKRKLLCFCSSGALKVTIWHMRHIYNRPIDPTGAALNEVSVLRYNDNNNNNNNVYVHIYHNA